MNNLVNMENKPVTVEEILAAIIPAKRSEILEMIGIMSDAFPSQQRDEIGTANRFNAYVMAVEDMPLVAIQAACRAFIRGEVDNASQTFLPSAAELANETRKQFWSLYHKEKKRTEKRPEPEPKTELPAKHFSRRWAESKDKLLAELDVSNEE